MKKKVFLLLLLFISGCSITPDDEPVEEKIEVDSDAEISTDLSGFAEILTKPTEVNDGMVEFEMKISASQENGISRMSVFADSINVPFSVNGGDKVDYYDMTADGVEKTVKFSADVSSIETNNDATLSISRISVPQSAEPSKFGQNAMFYFSGPVFEFKFNNANSLEVLNKRTVIPVISMDELNSALKKEIDESRKNSNPEIFQTIINDNNLNEDYIVKGVPSVLFYNMTNETHDITIHLFKDGEFLLPDNREGLFFTLGPGEGMEYGLSDFNLSGSRISIIHFIDGKLSSSIPPYMVE